MTAQPGDPSLECQRVVQRLIACHEQGERPGDDAGLAEHLGSCLGCFRASADLREVPRLAALLRGAADPTEALPDPGPAFWSSFPVQLGETFSRSLGAGQVPELHRPSPVIAGERAASGPTPWQRLLAWVRMPLPAAMAGAACATAVALLMSQPPSIQRLGQRPVTAEVEAAEAPLGSGQDDVAFAVSASVYDSLHDMDVPTLAHVRDAFGTALDRLLAPAARLGATLGSTDDDLPGSALMAGLGTVSDELDELDELELSALRERLGGGE